jgi:hypothetical protein
MIGLSNKDCEFVSKLIQLRMEQIKTVPTSKRSSKLANELRLCTLLKLKIQKKKNYV